MYFKLQNDYLKILYMVIFKALLGGVALYSGFGYYLNSLTLPPELTFSFEEHCLSKGYKVQAHDVTTEDGYILKLLRISSNKTDFEKGKTPVLMVHGLTHNPITYVIAQSSKAPAFALCDNDFDVWLLSTRGNNLSNKHIELDPNKSEYWQ